MLDLIFNYVTIEPEPTYVPEATFWWTISIIGIFMIIIMVTLIIREVQINRLNDEIFDLKKQITPKKEISLEDISKQLEDLKNQIH